MSNNMNIDPSENNIDEGLYSRQLYVLGHDAMKKMGISNVLVIGLGGLGVEIAKNLVLAGVKSVTLYDPERVKISDLSTQFFLKHSDIGRPRAESCVSHLAELNQYVPVTCLDGELRNESLTKFKVVVVTELPLERQLEINDFCHANGIHFISTEVRGLFGRAFVDFGENFEIVDATGEQSLTGMVAAVSLETEGVVTCLDETRHGFEDGDHVQFTEIQGMEALNNAEPRKVKVLGPYTFGIGDTTGLGDYVSGGLFTQVKMPKIIRFKSFRESLSNPEYVFSDFAKFDRPAQLHVGFQALHAFAAAHNGALPRPRNESDAAEIFNLAEKINCTLKDKVELDEELIKELAYQAKGDLPPMAAVLGGLVAQEVLKAASGKFHPIFQYFYFDSLESLPKKYKLTEENTKPLNTRYDGLIAVFGCEFQQRVQNASQFLVGSGAIGCEMLKNWAMMGLGTGREGKITITDMDMIEKSNLNRQFLFRPKDVGKYKSETAAQAAINMNPDLFGKVKALQDRVGPETENVFDDAFFDSLDGVTNALDNVDARKYVDRRCVYFRKPLLESGTLGTKGNTQVIIPFLTESYSSSQDPPEKSIPICTLNNFPNAIEHTIQWARETFDGLFTKASENVNLYLTQPNFLEATLPQSGNQKGILEQIRASLVTEKPLSFDECVHWARLRFEEYFNNNIQQLLFNFPKDAVTSSGLPFWSPPKRAPDPIQFDAEDPNHIEFIVSAANLHAFNYGLRGCNDRAYFKKVLADVIVPEFAPKKGVKIQVQENETVSQASSDQAELDELVASLPVPSTLAGFRLNPVEFEKDDDANFHIDFITATSNLRATNYGIATADRHNTKFIAGKIIPAIATTTALVAGLACLELYKILSDNTKLDDYKNGFVNLALPLFAFSEPIAAPKLKYHETEWTLWDRFDIDSNLTLRELIDEFRSKYNLTITMVSSGVSMLYAFFIPKPKLNERMPMKISRLVEHVSKKEIPAHVKDLVLEICTNDKDGEDVEVPYVRVRIRE